MTSSYDWLEPREHVKTRPDTYVGPISVTNIQGHYFDEIDGTLSSKITTANTSPAIFKLFDEVIVNAIDNSKRDAHQTFIKTYYNDGLFKVINNGSTIPIKYWEGTDRYIPEILVYELMSGQNFQDIREMVGGRNGLGLKIVNILSELFEIVIVNYADGLKYHQIFRNNADEVGKPKISKISSDTNIHKKSSTTIIWKPDYKRLGIEIPENESALIDLIKTRVYDASACTSSKISVYYNDAKLSITSMKDYITALGGEYIGKEEVKVNDIIVFEYHLSHVAKSGKCIGFVNGLQCSAGTHVDMVYRRIIEDVNELCKKKMKRACSIRPQQIKDSLNILINAHFTNPSFSSQTKEKCDLRVDKFGFSYTCISKEMSKNIAKSNLLQEMLDSLQQQEDKEVQKSVQQTKRQKHMIPKYQRALKKHANLYLTEGDSAMAMALSGFSVIGRDNNGVFPLRGKLVNVFGMKAKNALEHKEIMHLTQILQLEPHKVYDESNTKDLPYRHIIIFTDQDHDGSHIMGLILTFVREFFPSVLKLWPDYVKRFATHIVKAKVGNETRSFFSAQEYKTWCGDRRPSWVKYYKGLGTSTDEEAIEYFENIDAHLTEIKYTGEGSDEAIEIFFASDKADKRKEVLKSIDSDSFVNYEQPTTTFQEFCGKELIHHCAADNIRSIAHSIDGLKPSQRKILYTVRLNKSDEIKVASLAANTTDKTAYHHGEVSLVAAIMMMAQKHIGTNNIAYLKPIGQFGSRLTKRDDGLAAPRYIFTSTERIADFMFRREDDIILDYEEDDGKRIEPCFFVPVVANVLINGCEGIGTGYKTSIPNFNPLDVIAMTRNYIQNSTDISPILPYYHGFKGATSQDVNGNIVFTGAYSIKESKHEIHITELPPKVWSNVYFEWLLKNLPDYVTDVDQKSNKIDVFIVLKYKNGTNIYEMNLIEDLKLSTKVSLSQMNLFDHNHNLVKYNTVLEIIKNHASMRIKTYVKRLLKQIEIMTHEVNMSKEKARFLQECVDKTIVVAGLSKTELKNVLQTKQYSTFDDFKYLTGMEIFMQTKEEVERMKKLASDMETKLEILKNMTPEKLWLSELDELEHEYNEYLQISEKKKGKTLKKARRQGP